jgi:hypothetical protein
MPSPVSFMVMVGANACRTHVCGEEAGKVKVAYAMRLREALNLIGPVEGCDGFSFYECDPRVNYRTGAETRYAFHMPRNVTRSSAGRIARLLKAQRLLD